MDWEAETAIADLNKNNLEFCSEQRIGDAKQIEDNNMPKSNPLIKSESENTNTDISEKSSV